MFPSPSSVVFFLFFSFSCPQFSTCHVCPLDAVCLFLLFFPHCFPFPLPARLSVSLLPFTPSILASDIIYIGPVKGKPLLFPPLSLVFQHCFLTVAPTLPLLSSPSCLLSTTPSFLPPTAGG